jgi:hypothetical protein
VTRRVCAWAAIAATLAVHPALGDDETPPTPGAMLLESQSAARDDEQQTEERRESARCGSGDPVKAPYFGGLGDANRIWEVQTDAAFSTTRVATERVALAGYYGLSHPDATLGLTVRTDLGLESDTSTGFYAPRGPRLSLGIRGQSQRHNEVIETGIRLIVPWSGPHDADPAMLRLALGATLASGLADDAEWLAFHRFGYQVYLNVQQRLEFRFECSGVLILGARYGVVTSLAPLSVETWLGPEDGIIADAFLDVFAGVPWWRLPSKGATALNVQVGLHGEASLSSIWPGEATLPLALEPFLLWQPATWISVRAFAGIAFPAVTLAAGGGSFTHPYGARVTFYVP